MSEWPERTVRRAGDLVVDNMQGGGGSASSLGSEIGKAFETIYGVRLHVFKLKFGLKVLVSGLQSVGVFALLFVGGIMVLKKPKSVSWWPSSAASIASSILGAS